MLRVSFAALAARLALAATASAQAVTTTTVRGVSAAGPSTYDRTFVTKFGPAGARTVLVLMPGYSGGAGDLGAK